MRNEPFEVREYSGRVVAETLVGGDFDSVGNEGCRRLFAFISGANRGEAKVAMTAPVEQQAAGARIAMTAPVEQQRAEKRWRVAFVLPAIYSLATAPRPTDERVAFAEVESRRVVVVRYSGTWSERRYAEQLAGLRAFMAQRGLQADGEPIYARRDPPFMPWFMRRNEIQVSIRD
jgi:hypothetical protein